MRTSVATQSPPLAGPGSITGRLADVSQTPYAVTIILVNILAILALFTLRSIDDNRLTSWQWIFDQQQIYRLCLMLVVVQLLVWWKIHLIVRVRHKAWLMFMLATAISVVTWTEPEVIVDTSRYFSQAKFLAEYGTLTFLQQWGHSLDAWTDLPLVSFIYGLSFSLLGESRLVIQLITTLMFAGSIVLTYHIGKTLWDDSLGQYGGALLLAMPFLLTQVPLMLVDIPSMFFLTLAVFLSLQAVRQGSHGRIVFAAVAIAVAMLCKYSTWLMLTVLPMLVVILERERWQQAGRRLLLILLCTAVVLAPVILWKYPVIHTQLMLLSDYQLPGLQRWQESPLSTFFYQTHPFVSLAGLLSLYFALHNNDRRYLLIAWMPALMILFGINRSRYILPALPMLALLAAYSIRRITDVRLRHFLVLTMVTTSLLISLGGYRPFLQHNSAANLQQAGAWLDRLHSPGVEVIVLPQTQSSINPLVSIPLLDLYTRQRLAYRPMPGLLTLPTVHALTTSSLRFSWASRLPDYYMDSPLLPDRAIVIIADSPGQVLPAVIRRRLQNHHLSEEFVQQEGVFRYTTIVWIYESNQSPSQRITVEQKQG